MSALQEIKSMLPGFEEDSNATRQYECAECGNTFESAKPPDRAQCMDCLSHEVSAR